MYHSGPSLMDPLSYSDGDHSQDGLISSGGTHKTSNSAAYEMIPLEPDFEPTIIDVICARGKEAYNHPGNIRFRQLVQDHLHSYQTSTSKLAKSQIVKEIIESVRLASPKGGFVKKVNGKWFDVGERARREKTGQQIRDLLHTQYRSSTKAKAMTRKRLRKSHSANSATRVFTQDSALGVANSLAGRTGTLPARIITLDSESNSAAIAAARSALALQNHFRRSSEPDLPSMAARAVEPDSHFIRDTEHNFNIIRDEPEPNFHFNSMAKFGDSENNLAMNGMMNMNNMNMNLNRNMNQSSMMTMGTQGWGGSLIGDQDAFHAFQHQGQLLQHVHQMHQLSDLSELLQQPQNNPTMPQSTGFDSSASSYSPFTTSNASATQFDVNSRLGIHNIMTGFNTRSSMGAQPSLNTSAFGSMGQGQPYVHSFASSNTRPQEPAFSSSFQRGGRMFGATAPTDDFDPLLLPHGDDDNDDESVKSFEEAIDNIYSFNGRPKRV